MAINPTQHPFNYSCNTEHVKLLFCLCFGHEQATMPVVYPYSQSDLIRLDHCESICALSCLKKCHWHLSASLPVRYGCASEALGKDFHT